MTSRYMRYIRGELKKVWVRVVSFAGLALLSAGLARILSPYLPEDLALQTGSQAVAQLLGILTSSMLVVTTFSLSIAVSAFASVAGSATPRATVLLQEDQTTQNVLAVFLGAFLFGLVGLIALYAELYDASGKVVVFFFTMGVIGLVVVALIRWITHLIQFGRMSDTLDRVEAAAAAALSIRLDNPYLGGRPLVGAPPKLCRGIQAATTGYVQHIDMGALQACAEKSDAAIYVCRLPGSFVVCGEEVLAVAAVSLTEDHFVAISRAIVIGSRRTFEDDPRFGLIVLTEIASKALSPAVNDPGTAIDILGRIVRILSQWRERTDAEVLFPCVFVPPIAAGDVIEDAFRPIARDGAPLVEVQVRLQKALASLSRCAPDALAEAATRMARDALARAEMARLVTSDVAIIRGSCIAANGTNNLAVGQRVARDMPADEI